MRAPVVGLRAGDGVLPQLLAELLQLLLREAGPDLRDGLELLALWVVHRQQERSKHPRPLAPAYINQPNQEALECLQAIDDTGHHSRSSSRIYPASQDQSHYLSRIKSNSLVCTKGDAGNQVSSWDKESSWLGVAGVTLSAHFACYTGLIAKAWERLRNTLAKPGANDCHIQGVPHALQVVLLQLEPVK